jgi:anthranilate/para-aminobenzoate synthase component I
MGRNPTFCDLVNPGRGRVVRLSGVGFFYRAEDPEAWKEGIEEFILWQSRTRGFGILLIPYEFGGWFLGLKGGGDPALLYGFTSLSERDLLFVPDFPPGVGEWKEEDYRERFQILKEAIARGQIYLANLTQRFRIPQPERFLELPFHLLPRGSAILWDETLPLFLVSLSPETFLEIAPPRIATEPIKGTLRAGEILEELQGSPKERSEQIMVVDMCRNDLGRIAMPGTVRVSAFMSPLPLGYTVHLYSRIEGIVKPGVTLFEILSATFPPASVTGTPKREAVSLLRSLETSPRGYYCGTLGWVLPDGRAHFTLLIRTFYSFDLQGWFYGAGGGITWESDPQKEWEELNLKADPLKNLRGLKASPLWTNKEPFTFSGILR